MIRRITLFVLGIVVPGCGVLQRPEPGVPNVRPEYYAHSIAAIAVPGTRRAFQVGSGSVVSTGDVSLEWQLDDADSAVTSPVYFERDGVPVAHWWMVSARESLHFEAAAITLGALGDSSAVLSVRVTGTLRGPPGEIVLVTHVGERPRGPNFTPWDAEDAPSYTERWQGAWAVRNERFIARVPEGGTPSAAPGDTGFAGGQSPARLIMRHASSAQPGGAVRWDFLLPDYGCTPAQRDAAADGISHERIVEQSRAAWRKRLAGGTRLRTPDPDVDQAFRASVVTLLGCQERFGDGWFPIGNPFQYRDVWLRDGARVVRALAVSGFTELARANAAALLAFELPLVAFGPCGIALVGTTGFPARLSGRGSRPVEPGGRPAAARRRVLARADPTQQLDLRRRRAVLGSHAGLRSQHAPARHLGRADRGSRAQHDRGRPGRHASHRARRDHDVVAGNGAGRGADAIWNADGGDRPSGGKCRPGTLVSGARSRPDLDPEAWRIVSSPDRGARIVSSRSAIAAPGAREIRLRIAPASGAS